jgi:hypothetical protein
MNFLSAVLGIFFNPKETFAAISQKPKWTEIFILLLIVWILMAYITAPYSQQDSIRVFEDNIRLKERMGEERYEEMLNNLKNPPPSMSIIRPFVLVPISFTIGMLFSSLILFGMGRLTSTEGSFLHVFTGFLYANLIDKVLGNAVRLFLILSQKSVMETSTGLALFFPRLEVTSTAFIILSNIDFFQLWMFGIFSYGLASIFKIELKKALFISYGFWLLKTLVYIAIGLLSSSFMR